ncbi:hypothetical protein EDB85DRAFT_1900830 [Lactarius pseudohatsudake]|nr:hypothetical protein EDB85DRAFT_1900830 [Lactarius pseudohatsudake]
MSSFFGITAGRATRQTGASGVDFLGLGQQKLHTSFNIGLSLFQFVATVVDGNNRDAHYLQLQCMNPRARPPVVVLRASDMPPNMGARRSNLCHRASCASSPGDLQLPLNTCRLRALSTVQPFLGTSTTHKGLLGTSSVHLELWRALAGGGAIFVASGVDTSFTTVMASAPVNLTAQGKAVLWLGPCIVVSSFNSSSGGGNGAAGTREGMVGVTVLGVLHTGHAPAVLVRWFGQD